MKALWLLVAPGLLAAAAHAAPPAKARAAAAASAPAAKASQPARAAPHAASLLRLEAQLRSHLQQRGSWAAMPWREAVVAPDVRQLTWHPRAVTWRHGRMLYRPAYDPRTRWFYVLRMEKNGPAEYFGPLDELPDGQFVDWRRAP